MVEHPHIQGKVSDSGLGSQILRANIIFSFAIDGTLWALLGCTGSISLVQGSEAESITGSALCWFATHAILHAPALGRGPVGDRARTAQEFMHCRQTITALLRVFGKFGVAVET